MAGELVAPGVRWLFDKLGDWRAPRSTTGQRTPLYIEDVSGRSPLLTPDGTHLVKLWALTDDEAQHLGGAVGQFYKYLPIPDESKELTVDIQNLAIVLSTIIQQRIQTERLILAGAAAVAPPFERQEANAPRPAGPSPNGAADRVVKPVIA